MTRHGRQACGSEGACLRRAYANARLEDDVTRSDVTPTRSDVRSSPNPLGDEDVVPLRLDPLEGNNSVRLAGHRSSCRDRRAGAWGQGTRRCDACRDAECDRQRPGRVVGPKRIAVHGGAREGREVDRRPSGLGKPSSDRVGELHLLEAKRTSVLERELERLLDRPKRGHGVR
jgi:hypothetical protein